MGGLEGENEFRVPTDSPHIAGCTQHIAEPAEPASGSGTAAESASADAEAAEHLPTSFSEDGVFEDTIRRKTPASSKVHLPTSFEEVTTKQKTTAKTAASLKLKTDIIDSQSGASKSKDLGEHTNWNTAEEMKGNEFMNDYGGLLGREWGLLGTGTGFRGINQTPQCQVSVKYRICSSFHICAQCLHRPIHDPCHRVACQIFGHVGSAVCMSCRICGVSFMQLS